MAGLPHCPVVMGITTVMIYVIPRELPTLPAGMFTRGVDIVDSSQIL
jgi:hypothetical protein